MIETLDSWEAIEENAAGVRVWDMDADFRYTPSDCEPPSNEEIDRKRFIDDQLSTYQRLCLQEAGRSLSEKVDKEMRAANALLLRQDHILAERLLHETDVVPYEINSMPLWKIGTCSDEIEQLPTLRPINLYATVSKRKRAKRLMYLMEMADKNPFLRMWVFTAGLRCNAKGLRDRMQWIARQISRLNAEAFMKALGVQIVFRSTEIGTVTRDENGAATYHVHCHCIVQLKDGFIAPERWSMLLSKVHDFMGFHFDDSGVIEKVYEACKYLIKPQDTQGLSGAELEAFYHATKRLHLVQVMGDLKKTIKADKKAKKKLLPPDRIKGLPWRRVTDWNAHADKPKKEKANKVFEKTKEQRAKDEFSPVLVAKLRPGPHFGPEYEPAYLICAPSATLAMECYRRMESPKRLKALCMEQYEAARAKRVVNGSGIRVHTTTETVRPSLCEKSREQREFGSFRGGEPPGAASFEPPLENFHEKSRIAEESALSVGTGIEPVSQTVMFDHYDVNQMFD